MKKFFTFITLISAFVPAMHGMEKELEPKSLKRSCDLIDSVNDATGFLVIKKQKTEEANVTSNGLAKKIVYGPPVAKQTILNFGIGNKPQFVQEVKKIKPKVINSKKLDNNSFKCLECDEAFSTKKSLASHKGSHTAMKRAKRISAERRKEEESAKKIKNAS